MGRELAIRETRNPACLLNPSLDLLNRQALRREQDAIALDNPNNSYTILFRQKFRRMEPHITETLDDDPLPVERTRQVSALDV